jgi:dipeptidyl aminopeptidase/acylaminoacyl peptidase
MNVRLRNVVLCALALVVVVLTPRAWAQSPQKDRLTVDLFLEWEMVATPRVSPDGRQIVYTRRWADKVTDKYEDEIWIVDADGGRNRFLAKGSQAAWAPP